MPIKIKMGWIFSSKESGRVITVPSLSIAVSITIKTKDGEKKYNPVKINIPPKQLKQIIAICFS